MGKVSDDDTRVVLRKLACCFPAFYVLYYGAAAIVCVAFGLFDEGSSVFGKMPFNFELFEDFSFGEKPKLGAWRPPCCVLRACTWRRRYRVITANGPVIA